MSAAATALPTMVSITRWEAVDVAHGGREESFVFAELARQLATPLPRSERLPGWSPARFAERRRKKEAVLEVTALVLDVDDGGHTLEGLAAALGGVSAVIHSTRSSMPDDPCWRIVLEVARPMAVAEHAAVWRAVRDDLVAAGIVLDEGTRDASRFWFWPCVPAEGEYLCERLPGSPLDVDALARRVPVPRPELRPVASVPGIGYGGAALEGELQRIGSAREGERHHALNRSAFKLGQLVASGELDELLVRTRLIEVGDRALGPKRMIEVRRTVDEAMRKGSTAPRERAPRPEASAPAGATSDDATSTVLSALKRKKNGDPEKLVANVLTVFARDPRWQGVIAHNAFRECPILVKQPPQRAAEAIEVKPGSEWTSQDATRTAAWLVETYRLDVSSGMVDEAMYTIAERNQVHPVCAYLDGLAWDGVPRLDSFFSIYCGLTDRAYARGVARMLFLSAVARVRKPGCKVDTIIVLEGRQGQLKSTLLSILAGEWFADTPLELGNKDSYQVLRGVWLYELAELAALKGRDATRIKSFASSPSDTYRPSFGRRAATFRRQCVFVATTNEDHYLVDATGARRFWPIRVVSIDLEAVRRDRDQLWAEASHRIAAGEPWWPSRELDALGAGEQSDRFEGDPWEGPIAAWLDNPLRGDGVMMADVLATAVGMPKERQTKAAQERVAAVLHREGWRRDAKQRRVDGERVRLWRKRSDEGGGDTCVASPAGEATSTASPPPLRSGDSTWGGDGVVPGGGDGGGDT